MRPILATLVLSALALPAAAADLRVRASEALAPCLTPTLDAFTRETRVPVALEIGAPDAPAGAALVVGDDSELTRVLEGGTADVRTAIDLGYVPWVAVTPAGSGVRALSNVSAAEEIAVLGGPAGARARESLGMRRTHASRDARELARAPYALVPRTLAGPGEQRPAAVPPLVAVAAVVNGARAEAEARRLLAFLQTAGAKASLAKCFAPQPAQAPAKAAAPYASSVVDYWLPDCTLRRNLFNDPNEVVGTPNAVKFGGVDDYRGMMSLGQSGWVTVDMGASVVDGPGADIRVYQTTSTEEVTVYGAASPQGPFVLIGLREPCGIRSPGLFSNHCDFDLAGSGLAEARYLRVEDGEIYPCLAGDTRSEGADIDAVQALNFR
jgi:hypothetical protein